MDLTKLTKNKQEEIQQLEIYPDNSDFINKTFNHLTVIGKGPKYISPKGHTTSRWWCICDCDEHNIILVRRNNLVGGNTKSCGCQNNQKRKENIKKAIELNKLNLTNQKFGELLALNPTDQRDNGSVVWKCQCSCGSIHYVAANNLTSHRVESCGCSNDSKGIRLIKNILSQNNIKYITEYTFENCRFPDSNQKARFDFFINNEFLLEFDGEQHFKECDTRFFKDTLEQRQKHDQFKNNWCKENNIILKRIPYTDYKNITLENIMDSTYII